MGNWAKFVALKILAGYKWAISPMLPPACRYVPTCSEYAMEAVDRYGVLRGGLKAVARLLRCHPFAHGGYDPVMKESRAPWKRGASAPGPAKEFLPGFSPCAHQHLKRNA